MKKKSVVIGDIAKQLNVSKTTISFIINGKAKEKRISDELEAKVMKVVAELGYVPNPLAQSLRTGKTNIIGLIVEDISNPFFANIARKIEIEANDKGYKLFYCSSEFVVFEKLLHLFCKQVPLLLLYTSLVDQSLSVP
jgi:LacI family transcriptional regulator